MFVFKDFASKVRLSPRDVATDNLIFRLHYRLTFWFLLACGILVSSRQFINSHINCMTGNSPKVQQVLNTFCFFSSTFTVSKYYETNHTGHLGIGPYDKNDEIVLHAYYQWVPFVLFLQAIMFVLPHKIWKSLENNRLRNIVKYVESSRLISQVPVKIDGFKIDTYDKRESNATWLNTTYLSWRRFRINRDWAFSLVFCESLNFLNLILQIYLNNVFLQGKFIELGWDVFQTNYSLERVFPKVTKCTFHKYGQSGSIQNHDALCVMALNIINEKIYCVMWFWLACLLILNISGFLWRILTIIFHKDRFFNTWVWGEISPGPAIPKKEAIEITNNLWFSDWLFLYYLGKNINPDLFRRLVTQLSKEVQAETKNTQLIQNETGENSESFC